MSAKVAKGAVGEVGNGIEGGDVGRARSLAECTEILINGLVDTLHLDEKQIAVVKGGVGAHGVIDVSPVVELVVNNKEAGNNGIVTGFDKAIIVAWAWSHGVEEDSHRINGGVFPEGVCLSNGDKGIEGNYLGHGA